MCALEIFLELTAGFIYIRVPAISPTVAPIESNVDFPDISTVLT
jgi:hypothetical protein